MPITVATWNINSVRARIGIVERFLAEEQPDILCLQETKVVDETFPPEMFRRLGYNHIILHGQRMHHGVAIVSRVPMHEDDRLSPLTPYCISKRAGEDLLGYYQRRANLSWIALRFFNVYGPGQSLRNPYTGILSIFSVRLLDSVTVIGIEEERPDWRGTLQANYGVGRFSALGRVVAEPVTSATALPAMSLVCL